MIRSGSPCRGFALCLILGLAIGGTPMLSDSAAAEKDQVKVTYISLEKIKYQGWKNNLRISNGDAELIVTLDVGPRVISYRLGNGKNVFKEYAEQLGKTGESEWQIRGGHRLWVGPEDLTRTYALDNGPVQYKELDSGGVRFVPAPETEYGIQKEIDLKLVPTGSQVEVLHRVTNVGDQPASLAEWALTVLAPGGVEIIPLPPHAPHPGPPKNARSAADYAPNLFMSVWPFLDFKDPRWHFGTRFITLRQDANKGPTKLGLDHRMGWVGYLNAGTMFVKRFDPPKPDLVYPDRGCNFETFSNQDMLECETLGPILKLGPRETAEMTERWELIGGLPDVKTEADIEQNILPKIKGR